MLLNDYSTYPVGLDISDLSLKLVQLNKVRDKISIQAAAKCNLPKGLIENGEIKNEEEVVSAIKKMANSPRYGKVTSREICACLPEPKTFIKLMEIENPVNNIRDLAASELEKHVPAQIEELYFSTQIIGSSENGKLVLVGASPKKIVDQYLSVLKQAKFSVAALEVESEAISRALLPEENPKFKEEKRKNYCIIDIGAKRSSIFVYSKNTILFDISVPISGEEITRKIAETLKINEKQAEMAKIICGLKEENAKGIIKNILSKTIGDLTDRVASVLNFYKINFAKRGQLDEIILCGGGANIKGLAKIIEEKIALPAKTGNSFANLENCREIFQKNFMETHKLSLSEINLKDKPLSISQDLSLSYATAIGLSLRGIFIN